MFLPFLRSFQSRSHKKNSHCTSVLTHCFSLFPHRFFQKLYFVLLPTFLLLLLLCLFEAPPEFLRSEEQRFTAFTEDVFRQEMSGNTLNLHYTIADPSSYQIESDTVSLGAADPAARQASCAILENYQAALRTFDRTKLSSKRQLTYDVFAHYLETELSASDLMLYDEPLSPTLGVQAQLPILLAEYRFRTKGDIEDYLCLLTQIPDYFQSILLFEQKKSDTGLFMNQDCALAVIQQCEDFISEPDRNYLLTIFEEKIDQITNLTADEKIGYKNRNAAILSGYVIPAYQTLIQTLQELSGTGTNLYGLYYLPKGQEYYRYLIRSIVGDDREIEVIEEEIKQQMTEDYTAVSELWKQENQEDPSTAGPDAAPADILTELRQKIMKDFPLPPAVSCQVKSVHSSLQEYLSPAFYLTPPIDDSKNNIIYINPASQYHGLDLFTTLAHEGYPGHLYQTVYFQSSEPDLLRTILDVGGYTEGWATYVEMYAYSLWDGDPDTAALAQRNRSFTLGLASLLDIGIHYHGYLPSDIQTFLTRLGFDAETADSLYQTILQSPGNYLQYYVGYLNFKRLKEQQLTRHPDTFSLKEFHQTILELGPAPFTILEPYLQ